MAYAKLAFLPGVDKQNSEYGAEGKWIDSDYVRFRYGLPETVGGWAAFDNSKLIGMVSDVFSWNRLTGERILAVGTTRKLYVYYGGVWSDITPIRGTGSVTFDTVSGSTTVTVNDASHGATPGDFVTFSSVSGTPGGIADADLENEFEIQTIVDGNTYTILVPNAASSTASTAGAGTATYQINIGAQVSISDYGWGAGPWGASTWGTPRPFATTIIRSRVWQLDEYGEDLIAQLCGGSTYYWDSSVGVSSPAAILTNAPTISNFAVVSTPDRHLVLLGTESIIGTPSSLDPMLVRFSSQEDVNMYAETATNTAGAQRLSDGSEIVTAVRSRGQILIWTDTSLHGMQYLGPPFTFGFQQLGANCGCISPHAAVDINGLAFWMADDAFFLFDGTTKKMPCTVQDYVFKDLNIGQGRKVYASTNLEFNEVTWFYPSANSLEINRSVTYNYLENSWYTSSLARTAWQDQGVFPRPVATNYEPDNNDYTISTIYGLTPGRSQLFSHETGTTADGVPIPDYLQSAYFDIGDGDNMMFLKRIIPDFKVQTDNVIMQVLLRQYPAANATVSSLDPYIVTPSTQKVDTRARGRQMSLRLYSQNGGSWRYGTLRVDIIPDGLR